MIKIKVSKSMRNSILAIIAGQSESLCRNLFTICSKSDQAPPFYTCLNPSSFNMLSTFTLLKPCEQHVM
ncbi:hypothetical protein ACVWYG_003911 [Pedobacter sp. UYEF25]